MPEERYNESGMEKGQEKGLHQFAPFGKHNKKYVETDKMPGASSSFSSAVWRQPECCIN